MPSWAAEALPLSASMDSLPPEQPATSAPSSRTAAAARSRRVVEPCLVGLIAAPPVGGRDRPFSAL